jgi:cytochrome c biogenesis protein ResB
MIVIVIHVAIVLMILGAIRDGVMLIRPAMVLVALIKVTVTISDADSSKVQNYGRAGFRLNGRSNWQQHES